MSELADELARQIATLYGWCPARSDTEREKALAQLWRAWIDETGERGGPATHPSLSDERITELAREYDEHHAAVMARVNRLVETR